MGLLTKVLAKVRLRQPESKNRHSPDAQNTERLLREANDYEQRAEMEKALTCYEAALAIAPDLARAHFCKGNILLDSGDAQSALKAYKLAVKFKPDSAAGHYNLGNTQARLGDFTAALSAYRNALALKPDFADAEVALGRGLEECGLKDEAAIHFQQALAIDPGYLAPHLQQGATFANDNMFERAEPCFRLVLQIKPDHVDAGNNLSIVLMRLRRHQEAANLLQSLDVLSPSIAQTKLLLGNALCELGRYLDAVQCFDQAINLNPNDADVQFCKGVALQALGKFDLAELSYRQTLALNAYYADAHGNLGALLIKQPARIDAAIDCFTQALSIKPDHLEARCNLGNALQILGQLTRAEECFAKALEIEPSFAAAHCGYGTIFQKRGHLRQAEEHYRRAIALQPNSHVAHNNLGIVLNLTRRYGESMSILRHALELNPNYAEGHVSLANVLKDMGHIANALDHLHTALEVEPRNLKALSNSLFIHNYSEGQPAEELLSHAKRYGEIVAQMAKPFSTWTVNNNPRRRLRIGFVSGDLSNHPVGYFLEGVLSALSSEAAATLEIIAYPTHPYEDETSHRIKRYCSAWNSAAEGSDEALAQKIYSDQIDILFDLSGHTAHTRLPVFAWKPAPVQVSWIGYFATTGVSAMDYFVGDTWTLPASEERYFVEKIWRLPSTRLCFTEPKVAVDVNPLPALENGFITFCCFNNLPKLNALVLETWIAILKALPTSRLLIKSQLISEPSLRIEIAERFTSHGIESSRILLEEHSPRAEYLAAYQRVDIALDTFPYPGGTTTVEALWMGVPVVTLSGAHFLSRQGVGILMNAGLEDWIAKDAQEYIEKSVTKAGELQELAMLRASLRGQVLNSTIFDASSFAKQFEVMVKSMWETWCAKSSSLATQPQKFK